MTLDYQACGWHIQSELPLPDLLARNSSEGIPDLRIVLGSVPQLDELVVARPHVQMGADGTVRYVVEDVAAFRIDPTGQTIVVQPSVSPEAPDIRAFLLGTVWAIASFKAGRLPLHASCVRLGDRAVAFTGPTGAGKSTIAAAFLRRGHCVLADDLSALSISETGTVTLWPSFPRVKLWQSTLDFMGFDNAGLERVRHQMNKFRLPVGGCFDPAPRQLVAIHHIDHATNSDFQPVRLSRIAATARNHQAIYRPRLWQLLGGIEDALTRVYAVSHAVPTYRLPVRRDLADLDSLVDRLVAHLGHDGRP